MRISSDIEFTTKYDEEDFTFYYFHSSKIDKIISQNIISDLFSILFGVSGGAFTSSHVAILSLGDNSIPERLVLYYKYSLLGFCLSGVIWLIFYMFRLRHLKDLKSEKTSYLNLQQSKG